MKLMTPPIAVRPYSAELGPLTTSISSTLSIGMVVRRALLRESVWGTPSMSSSTVSFSFPLRGSPRSWIDWKFSPYDASVTPVTLRSASSTVLAPLAARAAASTTSTAAGTSWILVSVFVAVTTTWSSNVGATRSTRSTVASCPDATVTDWLTLAYPIRLALSVYLPGTTFAMRYWPLSSVVACQAVPSSDTLAPAIVCPVLPSVTLPPTLPFRSSARPTRGTRAARPVWLNTTSTSASINTSVRAAATVMPSARRRIRVPTGSASSL